MPTNLFSPVREWGSITSTETNQRGLQSNLWDRFSRRTDERDSTDDVISFFDDFVNFGTGTDGAFQGYGLHLDTGCTLTQLATEVGGVVQAATDLTDNDSVEIETGGGVAGLLKMLSASQKMVAFDCRVRFGQVTDTFDAFIGFAEEGAAADNGLFTDAGALADIDAVGFHILEADGNSLKFVHRKSGGAAQASAEILAPVAATWYRLGFLLDPTAPEAERLSIYLDNAKLSTFVTQTQIEAATFPAGEELCLAAGLKNNDTAAKTFDIDWWAAASA